MPTFLNQTIPPWFGRVVCDEGHAMGRLDEANQIVVQHKDRDTGAKITVPVQIGKTKDAITRLKAYLDGKKVVIRTRAHQAIAQLEAAHI